MEAQPISVWIMKVELFHKVRCDFRRLKLKALRPQFFIDRVHVMGGEIEARILVRCSAGRIWRHWTLVIEFVSRIQHDFAAAKSEEAPVKPVLTAEIGRRHDDFKPKGVTIKPYGCGHVVNL